jgi:hypothetical protein
MYLAQNNQLVDRAAGYIQDIKRIRCEYALFAEDKTDDDVASVKENYKQKHLLDYFLDASSHDSHILCIIVSTGDWQVFPSERVC